MSDVLEALKKAREVLKKEGYINLVSEIDEALKQPEMSISVPKGKLLVGIDDVDSEFKRAFVCLDNENLGLVDLCLAECVEESLREEDEEEGDIRLLSWGDINSLDETYESIIRRRDIETREEHVLENKPEEYPI